MGLKKYKVEATIPVFLEAIIEAEDEDDAMDKAESLFYLSSFAGNGGTDKLVGTSESEVSIYPGGYILYEPNYQMTAEELPDDSKS